MFIELPFASARNPKCRRDASLGDSHKPVDIPAVENQRTVLGLCHASSRKRVREELYLLDDLRLRSSKNRLPFPRDETGYLILPPIIVAKVLTSFECMANQHPA